jgi:hypothetical protein
MNDDRTDFQQETIKYKRLVRYIDISHSIFKSVKLHVKKCENETKFNYPIKR